ncbi:organic cation transporter protein-like [Pararge aegeria]|uniref:Jg15628 protein n=1 Tax=Pararge aegeria aegeria TaxID=348720 RepID=A0A8S4RUB4_9NEOP|nr:organic cation transporter protein-like [Pararge aegeria]CAH2241431.1 jg15628 [Pararge aegeria aegeria]
MESREGESKFESPIMDRKEGFINVHGESPEKPVDLDDVLTNELGQFGRFQLRNFILVAIPIIMSAFMSEFIFSAAAIPHRCRIPECDEIGKRHEFEPDWIRNAIPESGSGFSSTQRFAPRNLGVNGSLDNCPADLFDPTVTIGCDGFVYARFNSVVYDFDLGGQEWLRALSGTLNSVGTLLVLPLTGYISDRFGRRIALVISVFNLATIGLIRSFSVNYPMYMALQILQTTLGAGTFSSAYIFAAELVGPKYRVLSSATSTSMFALGQVILGSVAWLIEPWRYMIMALHIPCFLIISYYWILSESVRWLLAKRKFDEAKIVLEKVAKVNRKQISEKSMQGLLNPPQSEQSKEGSPSLFKTIIRSPVLLRRVCTTPIWWITSTFVYYGLSINSTSLSDTMHLNYILTCAIEIPGFYTAVLVLDRIGRKVTLCIAFFFSAACNIAFVFIPNDLFVLRLVIFLLGKFGISTVMTSVYLYTSELYPTEYRHSLLAFSSMVGRLGSITAPLTPVLMQYWHGIPSMMFGAMGILSGFLVLTQPETLGTKMPNTLAEAEALGRPESKVERPS